MTQCPSPVAAEAISAASEEGINARMEDSEKNLGKPVGLAFRSSKGFITFVVCVATFTDTFLYSLIIPILPDTLVNRAGVPRENVQNWISVLLGVYGAANLTISPIAGYLIDKSSTRRLPLLLGLYALMGSTAMYCFGRTATILVVARALQGASATVLWVAGMALLSDTMGASTAGAAMGWQAVGRFFGVVLGPSLSGIVFELSGHYAVFGMAFIVLVIDVVLRFAMIERKVAEKWIVEDIANSRSVSEDTPLLENASGNISPQPSATPVENNARVPSTLELLTNTRLLMALWAQFLCSITLTALESVIPLYTMQLFNWNPAESGSLFVLLAFSVVVDPYIGHVTDTQGPRRMSVAGFFATSVIWLAFCTVTSDTLGDKIVICIIIFTIGFSIGLIATPNTVEISLTVDHMNKQQAGGFDTAKVMGLAYSFMNMAYGIGSIVGPFWGGALIQMSGWRRLCISFAILNTVSVCLAHFFSGGPTSTGEVLDAETPGS
ncbi:major facilitator superfamily domain-containing protein [Halenospora varia]|nr:major facilitator superfamily domain-containing protein [Halenospora varia]